MKTTRARPVHRHLWLIDPLVEDPTLIIRAMFGGKAVYFRGRFILFLVDKEEPWRGVLIPTERSHQPSLITDFPAVSPHPVLPKWLYLPETADSFETDASQLVTLAQRDDDRVGIIPPQKRASKPRHQAAKKK